MSRWVGCWERSEVVVWGDMYFDGVVWENVGGMWFLGERD